MKGAPEVASQFARNLVFCRKRAGLSQEELGYRAQVHRSEVSLLERGARTPQVDTILKLAGALSVPVSDLLAGLKWTPGEVKVVGGGFEVARRPEQP